MASNRIQKFFGIRREKKAKSKSSDFDDNIMEISMPTNVKHEVHVGFDSATGQFFGLPPVWDAWLQQSKIG